MNTTQFEVAGVMYRMAAYRQARVARGDRLTLVLEPDNKYDAKAIKVMKGDLHVGYVPKSHNKQLHEHVRCAAKMTCCVDAAWANGCWAVVDIQEEETDETETNLKGVNNDRH